MTSKKGLRDPRPSWLKATDAEQKEYIHLLTRVASPMFQHKTKNLLTIVITDLDFLAALLGVVAALSVVAVSAVLAVVLS